MKYLKVIAVLIVIFALLKEGGAFSNLFPDFASLCSGRFLLPEDQRDTINKILIYTYKSNCSETANYYAESRSLVFTGVESPNGNYTPPFRSLYPLKTMTSLTYAILSLETDDIKPLENLTEIKSLTLIYYAHRDFNLTPRNQSPTIQYRDLPVRGYTELEPLKKLKKLEHLNLVKSANGYPFNLNSLLLELPNLRLLSIVDLDFTDISSISNFQNLQFITLTVKPGTNLNPLLNLKRLQNLKILLTPGAKCPKFARNNICSIIDK